MLFTVEELASYLQQDVETCSAELARDSATGMVESITGPLEAGASTISLPILASGIIDLPGAVVTAVSDVTVDGESVAFTWQAPYPRVRVHDWDAPADLDDWPLAVITYSRGYTVVPAVAKAVALSVAGRLYSNPTGAEAERIDDYETSASAGLTTTTLTDYETAALRSIPSIDTAVVIGV